jgi:hypothetical protein
VRLQPLGHLSGEVAAMGSNVPEANRDHITPEWLIHDLIFRFYGVVAMDRNCRRAKRTRSAVDAPPLQSSSVE